MRKNKRERGNCRAKVGKERQNCARGVKKGAEGINNFITEKLAAEKRCKNIEGGETGEMLAEPNMDAILPASLVHT